MFVAVVVNGWRGLLTKLYRKANTVHRTFKLVLPIATCGNAVTKNVFQMKPVSNLFGWPWLVIYPTEKLMIVDIGKSGVHHLYRHKVCDIRTVVDNA